MSIRPVVILLLGPTGSGKSTFVKHATNKHVDTGVVGGAKPCVFQPFQFHPTYYQTLQSPNEIDECWLTTGPQGTTECKIYDLRLDGVPYVLIDTPGFEDAPPGSLHALRKIAAMLQSTPSLEVTGVVYFHRITDGRLTGSARFNLSIFKQVCGERFFPHVAFVTTMWDIVGGGGYARYAHLNRELEEKHMRLVDEGPDIFKFDRNDRKSSANVLRHFGKLASTSKAPPLLFFEQLRAKSGVRKTSAGKEAMRKSGRNSGGACTIL